MANVPDADVLLFGSVFKVDQKTNRETGETKHVVTVFAGEGVLLVNIKDNDYKWVEIPERGDTIAWYVRSAPYNVDGNSGMSSRFLRRVVPADLEAIAHALQGKQAPKAA